MDEILYRRIMTREGYAYEPVDAVGQKGIDVLEKALAIVDKNMKESNGHYYYHMLKTQCQFCGRSPRDKRRCGQWFQTFISRLKEVYLTPELLER